MPHLSSFHGPYLSSDVRRLDAAVAAAYTRVSAVRLFRKIDIRVAKRIIQVLYIQFDFNKSDIPTLLIIMFPQMITKHVLCLEMPNAYHSNIKQHGWKIIIVPDSLNTLTAS